MLKIFFTILVGIALFVTNVFLYLGKIYYFSSKISIWPIFFVLVLAADAACLFLIIKTCAGFHKKKLKKTAQQQLESEKMEQAEELRRKDIEQKKREEERQKEEERLKILEYNRRQQEAKVKSDETVRQYSLESYIFQKQKTFWAGKKFKCKSSCLNTSVMDTVKNYGSSVHDILQRSEELKQQSRTILNRRDFASECDRLSYLNTNLTRLAEMRQHINDLQTKYQNIKIECQNQDNEICTKLAKAFSLIGASEKFSSEDIKRDDMLKKELPEGFSMFRCASDPATLFIQDFYYCMLDNVILVFDNNGFFSAALDPAVLSIKSERVSTRVYFTKSGYGNDAVFKTNNAFVGADSGLVETGEEERTWLYTCKDGSPDRRYRNNPTYVSRWDVWEYGLVTIRIAEISIKFTVSSVACADALGTISQYYPKRTKN